MILIVDDEKEIGTCLECQLRFAGHEAVSVTAGAEALAMLHVRKPSLLVLDVNMPELNGLTVRLGALDFLIKGTIGFDKVVARICEPAGELPMAN